MESFSSDQVHQFIEDIGFLRKAIQKNQLLIQQIALPRSLRLTSLFSGTAAILLAVLFMVIERVYGAFSSSPMGIRIAFWSAIALAWVIAAYLKGAGILHEARQIDPSVPFWKIATEVYTNRIGHFAFTIIALVVFAVILAFFRGFDSLWLPISSFGIGIMMVFYYVLFRIHEFIITGYWFIAGGALLLLFPAIPAATGIIVTFGLGMLVMGGSTWLVRTAPVQKLSEG